MYLKLPLLLLFYFFFRRCVPDREDEELEVAGAIARPQVGKPPPRRRAGPPEAPAVYALLHRHRVSTLGIF